MRLLPSTLTPEDTQRWTSLVTSPSLAVLVDLDGTLIDFAATPERAVLDTEAIDALVSLREVGVKVVIVSGRTSESIAQMRSLIPGAWWAAEHGSWRWDDDGCVKPAGTAPELDQLARSLEGLCATPGVLVERKSMSLCIHWRLVDAGQRASLVAALELACDEWLEAQPRFERMIGVEVLEVRERSAHKGLAVEWVRQRVENVRIIAIGDDTTDEDMFAELHEGDAAVAVGARQARHHTDGALAGPQAVRQFLRWIVDARKGRDLPAPIAAVAEPAPRRRHSLVVVSNRAPSALEPALRDERGMWIGWSGQQRSGATRLEVQPETKPARATFDLPPHTREQFYSGFCNSVLWPLFHGFSNRMRYQDGDWEAYVRANDRYARHVLEVAQRGATIWVHDYHLLLAARALRRLGHQGRIGLFLHTPFPTPDMFETMPWGYEVLDAMLDFDLIGFQTARYAAHFLASAQANRAEITEDSIVLSRGRMAEVGVFPATIDTEQFRAKQEELPEIRSLRQTLGERKLLLAVDRLDYSKGVPERLAAYERFLEQYPQWRGKVVLLQVSVPSRADVPEYADLRTTVERLVGRINGAYGETDWVPVRYLYRGYDQHVLAQLYRLADVALVTPLRDGMNLVAKEFVAAQERTRPGVLVLSQYAGAADSMSAAVITNPFHADGFAADIDRALRMGDTERIERQRALEATLERAGTPRGWAKRFLDRLGRHPLRVMPPPALTVHASLDR